MHNCHFHVWIKKKSYCDRGYTPVHSVHSLLYKACLTPILCGVYCADMPFSWTGFQKISVLREGSIPTPSTTRSLILFLAFRPRISAGYMSLENMLWYLAFISLQHYALKKDCFQVQITRTGSGKSLQDPFLAKRRSVHSAILAPPPPMKIAGYIRQ